MNQSDMIFFFGWKEKFDIKLGASKNCIALKGQIFFLTKSYQMIDENLFQFSVKLKIIYMIFMLPYILFFSRLM